MTCSPRSLSTGRLVTGPHATLPELSLGTDVGFYTDISIAEPGSSVSIVSGYGLDDRAIEVRCPTETKGFFLQPLCPDRLWGPPSLLYNGYRGSFPRG
jgi:hypothetical protein